VCLYGIAAALPVFRTQGFRTLRQHRLDGWYKDCANHGGLFRDEVRGSRHLEGLRQEAGDHLRVTIISPGMVRTNFADGRDESDGQSPPRTIP